MLVRSVVATAEEPDWCLIHIFNAMGIVDCISSRERFSDLSEPFQRDHYGSRAVQDIIQRDVQLLADGLKGAVSGVLMRQCLDRHLGIDITFCRMWSSAFARRQTMHVAGLAVLYLGVHTPHSCARRWFDLSACHHPITKLSQLEAVVRQQAPLPPHWVHTSRPVCMEPYYYGDKPQHGEAPMPQRGAAALQRVRRPCTPPHSGGSSSASSVAEHDALPCNDGGGGVDAESDFGGSGSDAGGAEHDVSLEAVSPCRTMWQFVYQLENTQDGSTCMMCLQLAWSKSTEESLGKLRDPAFYSARECAGFMEYTSHQKTVMEDLAVLRGEP